MAKRSLLLSLWILLLSAPAFSQAVVGIQPQSLSPSVVVVQSPSGAVFTTLNCNGSIGTSGQVLVGGNPCTWTGSPAGLTSISFGSTPAAAGVIRLSNNTFIESILTNSTTVTMLGFDNGNNLAVGDNGGNGGRTDYYAGSHRFRIGTTAVWDIDSSGNIDDDGTHTINANKAFVSGGTGLAVANVGANSCGTTAATIAGGNNAFVITVGATSGSQCRVTFTFAAATEWDCSYTGNSATLTSPRVVPVDTTHTDFIATFGAGQTFTALCFPR